MPDSSVTDGVGWRRMPVFIASTFRDMDYERDVLARLVIPTVNERLWEIGRGVSIYPVDLRWGIETDDRLDVDTRQRMILETCVSEVRRCWPLFIGLLGSKYGWVPPDGVGRAVLQAAGLRDPGFPPSATAIEILSAAHAADGIAPILLARRARLAELTAAAEAGAHIDLPGSSGSDYLARLEDHIVGLGHSFQPYEARWQQSDQRFESTAFAGLVTNALLNTLDELLASEGPDNWLDAELAAQRWAGENETRQFVGRARELNFISDFWGRRGFWRSQHDDSEYGDIGDDIRNPLWPLRHQEGRTTLAVIGSSGSGKSALLAKVATDLSFRSSLSSSRGSLSDYVPSARAYVQVGVTAASERLPVCLLLLLAQLNPTAAQSIAAECSSDGLELDDVLDTWLETLETSRPPSGPLIVVDGIDRLAGALTESQPLVWLPITLRDRVRVLVSAVDQSFEARLLSLRPSTHVLELGDLTARDAVDMVRTRVEAHHKAMPPGVVESLASTSATPRWLVVATELLLTLMAHDYLVLQHLPNADADPESAIRHLLELTVTNLPTGLGDIHEEAFSRLFELVDERLGAVLGLLGASVFGVDEQDMHAVLELLEVKPLEVELALFRDALSAHLQVRQEQWRFAHHSAADGVDQLLDAASEAVGHDVRAAYRKALIRHLMTKPVDDPIRSRELLTLLLQSGELQSVVKLLANRDLATDDSVRTFAAVLSALPSEGIPTNIFADLINSADGASERLTTVQLVAVNVLPHLTRDDSTWLATLCRDSVARMSAHATSRFGLSPSALLQLIDAITRDPFIEHDQHAIVRWLSSALHGNASLQEMPVATHATEAHARIALGMEISSLTEYALNVHLGAATPTRADAMQARKKLDAWNSFVESVGEQEPSIREYMHLVSATAERASSLAWPGGQFHPVDSDFARLQVLTDRSRGNADLVLLLGLCARARAFEAIRDIDLDEPVTGTSARQIHEALEFLEEAMWQLDVQLSLAPDSVAVQSTAIQCGMLHSTLLDVCDQQASACRSVIKALSLEYASDVLGLENFIRLAGDSLHQWNSTFTDVDPTVIIQRLIPEIYGDRPSKVRLAPEEVTQLEVMLLASSLTAAKRLGHFDLATRVLRLALEGLQNAEITFDDEMPPLDALAREFLADFEDELMELIENLHDVESEDVDRLVRVADRVYDMRMALISHALGDPADTVGASLCAAFSANLMRDPQRYSEAAKLRGTVDPTTLDDRCRVLAAATDALLQSARLASTVGQDELDL